MRRTGREIPASSIYFKFGITTNWFSRYREVHRLKASIPPGRVFVAMCILADSVKTGNVRRDHVEALCRVAALACGVRNSEDATNFEGKLSAAACAPIVVDFVLSNGQPQSHKVHMRDPNDAHRVRALLMKKYKQTQGAAADKLLAETYVVSLDQVL